MSQGVFPLYKAPLGRRRGRSDVDRAVVLAGGRGTRLAPFTSVLPKPLMPIGDRSILELVIDQLVSSGITSISLCVGYLSHLIEAVLENGGSRGAGISYVREQHALGTAAPLRLVDDLDETFIAMNGDVLTTLDYRLLVEYHRAQGNLLTIAARQRHIKIDYGVLHLSEEDEYGRVRTYEEKPEMTSAVSMGIYVLEPEALEYIPTEGHFDFPDLVQALLADERPVGAYQYEGLWFDIGRREDYEQAVDAWTAAASHDQAATAEAVVGAS